MATVVTYNGITLNGATTTRFQQVPQYDASGTDVIFSRFFFTFEGICHAQGRTTDQLLPWIGQSGVSTLPTVQQAFTQISAALWQPRQSLNIVMGNNSMFTCDGSQELTSSGTAANSKWMDLDNGPKPKNVTLTHITSNANVGPTFHVTFDIECARSMCPGGAIQPLLNNRWSIGETLDEEFFTVRTIAGQMKLSQIDPDWDGWRNIIVPTLEDGFRRDRIDFNDHPDGLTIDYVVTDKQIHTAAPWPATKINVRHSESTGDGGKFESECHVSIHGHPGASKVDMFALGVKIIEDRLGKAKDMGKNNLVVPVAFSMVDVIGERNEIELYMKTQHGLLNEKGQPADNPNNFLGTPLGSLGRPLGSLSDGMGLSLGTTPNGSYGKYDPTQSHVPNVWGYNSQGGEDVRTSGITKLLLRCYLQVPCNDKHAINTTPQTEKPGSQVAASPDTSVFKSPSASYYSDLALSSKVTTPETSTGIYTHAAAEVSVSVNPLVAQLAIAADPTEYKIGDDTSVFVVMGLPQATLIYNFECEMVGAWPNVPQPLPTFSFSKITARLLGFCIKPMPPTIDATGTKAIYHARALITYGLSRPPQANEPIPIGVLPFTSFKPDGTKVALQALYNGPNCNMFGTGTVNTGQNPTGYS